MEVVGAHWKRVSKLNKASFQFGVGRQTDPIAITGCITKVCCGGVLQTCGCTWERLWKFSDGTGKPLDVEDIQPLTDLDAKKEYFDFCLFKRSQVGGGPTFG